MQKSYYKVIYRAYPNTIITHMTNTAADGMIQILTLPGEKLLFAKRQHLSVFIFPFIGVIFLTLLGLLGLFYFFQFFLFPLIFFLICATTGILLGISLCIKLFVDWYFHVYIITTRKIIEVAYKPLHSKDIFVVSLDQVRCIEVRSQTQGFFQTLFDIGNVIIHLDLLTHEDTFTLAYIASPHVVAISLGDVLNTIITEKTGNSPYIQPPIITQHQPFANQEIENNNSPSRRTTLFSPWYSLKQI